MCNVFTLFKIKNYDKFILKFYAKKRQLDHSALVKT